MSLILDNIGLYGIRLEASIGVHDFEKHLLQTLIVDIEIHASTEAAEKSDDIKDAIDYSAVAALVIQTAHARHYNLIENLGSTLAQVILSSFIAAAGVEVTVHKPGALKNVKDVTVHVKRMRS